MITYFICILIPVTFPTSKVTALFIYVVFLVAEPATVQNPTAVHSARDDFLKVCLKK